MKKAITLTLVSALFVPFAANAQGVKFGKRYMKQRMVQRRLDAARKATVTALRETQALKVSKNNALDEYEEREGDRIFRYVYAYDKDKMRSSETIYMKEKTDGTWSAEKLYTVGHYTYGHDTQGRLISKAVTYSNNDYFNTYRIEVEYGDGITEYKKYELDNGSGEYLIKEEWSYYDNGVLASYAKYDDAESLMSASTFDTDGVCTGHTHYGTRKVTFGVEPDNPTVTYWYLGYDDNTSTYKWMQDKQETYKYDPDNGRLVEYTVGGESYDIKKYTYTYDTLGRITAITEYGEVGDDISVSGGDLNGDGVIDENDRPGYSATRAVITDSVEWEIDYEETYTYFNDDVYGVGNSWHDVFGMDGPVTRIDMNDYDYKTSTMFERDTDGRLTGILEDDGSGQGYVRMDNITIDENGHITRITDEYTNSSEGYYYCNRETTDYAWTDGQAITAEYLSEYRDMGPNWNESGSYKETTHYTYEDGKVTKTLYFNNETTPGVRVTIEENGTDRKMHRRQYLESIHEDIYLSSYMQTEDISFVRPNVQADIEGMTADSTIVVSVAGRMVCAYDLYDSPQTGFHFSDDDNNQYYVNTASGSTYFAIEHDGNETICSDIKGRPIYVLEGKRLTREYKYHGILHSPVEPEGPAGQGMQAYTVSVPEGEAYDEITYVYDSNGRLTGKTEVSVDENGTRTETINLEYTYDDTSGIATVEATSKAGITLNGRRIGISDNSEFCVCTIGGQVIAAGVTSYTFNSPGIYIVNAAGIKTKVSVK